MSELELAKRIIVTYLSSNINVESLNALHEIQHGNKKELKEHIDTLKDIFEVASKELEKELENSNK